ncbi:MAG: type I methionyl aminopeptidase, partial [Candidatus Cloacimonetes bacterium]|nr:type I methionyl aminopeptidase [Candidatus Cloacimonadota bacterium]
MIIIKSAKDIDKMRKSNQIVGLLLAMLASQIRPGVSTRELDDFAEDFIRSRGAVPSFKGYQADGLPPFPAAICASINQGIVHGIPSTKKVLAEGDIIGIDVGVYCDGFHGDGAHTYAVGNVSREAERLMQVTRTALERGIAAAREGNRVGDISAAIGEYVQSAGYYVADNLTGHGIGRHLHEEPQIPNSGTRGRGPRLKKGMTLAIEPMVNIGTNRVREIGWEFFCADDSLSAH